MKIRRMPASLLTAGGLALAALAGTSGGAGATDNCPRLPSAALVIVIPEGGCDQGDATAELTITPEVRVFRGRPLAVTRKRPDHTGTVVHAAAPKESRVIVVVIERR